MKNFPKVSIGVGGLVIREKAEVLLIKRNSDLSVWTIPSGFVENKEDLFQTIKREVKEETGININPRGVIGVRQKFAEKEGNNLWVIVLCEYLSGKENPDKTETSQVKFMTFTEALKKKITPVTKQIIQLYLNKKIKILTEQKSLNKKDYKFFS